MNFRTRAWNEIALDVLRRDGIVKMPSLSREQMESVLQYLMVKEVVNAHVWAKGTEPPVSAKEALKQKRWPAFCHRMEDIVTAPFLFVTALTAFELAQNYFGESPRLYSMNGFWTQPSDSPEYRDTHEWHRDADDRKQLVMFIYGTDIKQTTNGAHIYQKGTHRDADKSMQGYNAGCNVPLDRIETVIGDAGTIFMADTSAIHMGLRPDKPRLLIWARFGVSNPPESYKWDKLSPVPKEKLGNLYPDNSMLQEAIKLVVA